MPPPPGLFADLDTDPAPAPAPAPRRGLFDDLDTPDPATVTDGGDTYHRDRLRAYLSDPDTVRHGADQQFLASLRENADREAQAALPDLPAPAPYSAAALTPAQRAVQAAAPSIGPDRRTMDAKAVDMVHAGVLGARTGVYQTASALDSALNRFGVVSDDTEQNMHDLAKESAQASNFGGAQGAVAGGANLVTGSAAYLNPVLAPMVAGGAARESILDTTGHGLLSAGDQRAADLVAALTAAGAYYAPGAGRAVGGTIAKTAPRLAAPLAEAGTAGAAYTVPEAIGTGVVSQDDAALQEQAKQQIAGLPVNVAGMSAVSLLSHALANRKGAPAPEPAPASPPGFDPSAETQARPLPIMDQGDTTPAPTPRLRDPELLAKLRQAGISEHEIADLNKHQAGLALDERDMDAITQDPDLRPERGDIPALLERMKGQDPDATQTDLAPFVRDETLPETQEMPRVDLSDLDTETTPINHDALATRRNAPLDEQDALRTKRMNPLGDRDAEDVAQSRAQELSDQENSRTQELLSLAEQDAADNGQRAAYEHRQVFMQRMAEGRKRAMAERQATAAKDEQWRQHVAQQLRQRRTGVVEREQLPNPYGAPKAPEIPSKNRGEVRREAQNRARVLQSEEEGSPEPAAITGEHIQALTDAISKLHDHLAGDVPRSTEKISANNDATNTGQAPKESSHGILEAEQHPERTGPVPGRQDEGQRGEARPAAQGDRARAPDAAEGRPEDHQAERGDARADQGHDPDQEPAHGLAPAEGAGLGEAAHQEHPDAAGRAQAPVPRQPLEGVEEKAPPDNLTVYDDHGKPMTASVSISATEDGGARITGIKLARPGGMYERIRAPDNRFDSFDDAHRAGMAMVRERFPTTPGASKAPRIGDANARTGRLQSPGVVEGGNPAPAKAGVRGAADAPVSGAKKPVLPDTGKPVSSRKGSAAAPNDTAKPSGVAPGDRANARPDLAIPSDKPAVRDFIKTQDAAAPERVPTSREAQRAEGEARHAADPQGEAVRLRKKMQARELLTESERHQVVRVVEDAYARGDITEATVMQGLYRANRGDLAADLASGYDPSESPAQRGVRHIRENLLAPPQAVEAKLRKATKAGNTEEANRIAAAWAKEVAGLKAKIRKLGVDPDTLEPITGPARSPKADSIITRRRQKLAKDMDELRDRWRKLGDKKSINTNAIGGERSQILGDMLLNRIEAGIYKFGDAVRAVVRGVPGLKKEHADIEAAWERVREAHPDLKLEEAGSADEAINGTPEEQLARAVAKAQKLADAWAEKHAQAKAMSPQERLDYLQKRIADKQVPRDIREAVAGIKAETKRLQQEVRQRDRAIVAAHDRVLGLIAAAKGDKWDVSYEWYRSAMHTSLKLPFIKAATDIANLAYHTVVNRSLGSVFSGTANVNDVMAFKRALGPALNRAGDAFRRSMADERAAFDQDIGHARAKTLFDRGEKPGEDEPNEFHQRPMIQNRVLKHVRWNIRTIVAMDQFAKALTAHLEVAAHAHESGLAKKLEGRALDEHIASETDDLGSDAWKAAMASARDVTGTTPHQHGPVAWINRVKSMDIGAIENPGAAAAARVAKEVTRYSLPFVALPFNFVAKGLRIGPTGTLRMLYKAADSVQNRYRNGEWTYKTRDIGIDVAQQIVAWGTLATINGMMDNEDPGITGYEPWNAKEADIPAHPAHSVRLFGEWRDYSKLGPAAHLLGTAVDLLRGAHAMTHGQGFLATKGDKGKDRAGALEDFTDKLVDQVKNETFLKGLSDLYEGVTSGHGAERMAVNWAAGFVPTMFKQAGASTDEHKEQRRIKDDGTFARMAQMGRQRLEIPGTHDVPAVDLFGHDIAKDSGAHAVGDYLARLVNPFEGQPVQQTDADLKGMLLRWNNDHPTDKVLPTEPDYTFTVRGERREMDPQQYHDFLHDAGSMAATMLRKYKALDVDHPTAKNMLVVRKVFSEADRMARARVVGKAAKANDKPQR